jgi:hypothetical protein
MKRSRISRQLLGGLLIVLLAVACGAPARPSTPSPIPPTITPFTPTATPVPKPSATSTPIPTTPPLPTWTPAPTPISWDLAGLGRIAYYNDDSHAVFLMNPDGSEKRLLIPDSDRRIELFPIFSWSPDGQSLAYSTHSWSDILIYSFDEAQSRDITNVIGKFELQPNWSPDGRKIAFSGNLLSKLFNIYVMNRDGSGITQLTDCAEGCRAPDWSPSGEYIAYQSGHDINVMKSDGSGARRIASGQINTLPAWSPDGQQVAFLRAEEPGPHTLYLVNQDGTVARALTDTSFNPTHLSWSPDGRYIVFDNYMVGEQWGTLWLMDVESGALKQIAKWGNYSPAWSPLKPTESPDCTAAWTRLRAGGLARLMGDASSPPNRVRSGPKTGGNIIALIPAGTIVAVLEGPVCADGLVFWKVSSSQLPGRIGWTAEGDGTEYWLEPYGP